MVTLRFGPNVVGDAPGPSLHHDLDPDDLGQGVRLGTVRLQYCTVGRMCLVP